jgi:hypothetical protein
MAKKAKSVRRSSPVRVFLDGKSIRLPAAALNSLETVRTYLELTAMRQDRILLAFTVDGKMMNIRQPFFAETGFQQIRAHTISFGELGLQLAGAAKEQAQKLQAQAEACVSVVLINPWHNAHRLMQELQTELRMLIILICFLNELCAPGLIPLRVNDRPFGRHMERLGAIRGRLEAIGAQQDTLQLSDELEHNLAPWLEQLGTYLVTFCSAA